MQKTWQFTINGKAATGETWATSGTVHCEFADSFKEAVKDTFLQLTHGRATYGQPGVAGCKGPYRIMYVLIEELQQ